MSNKNRFLSKLFVIAFALTLFARPTPTWACSCIMPPAPAQAFVDSQAVFVGTVTGISNPSQIPIYSQIVYTWAEWTNSPLPATFYNQSISFAVNQSWKGVTSTQITVATGESSAGCGYPFATGQDYVVYAYDFDGSGLQTNICTRTADIANATADLTYLNAQPNLTLSPSVSPLGAIALAGAGLLVVLAAAGVWIVRRKPAGKKELQ